MDIDKLIEQVDLQIEELKEERKRLLSLKGQELSLRDKLSNMFLHGTSEDYLPTFNSRWLENIIDNKLENNYRHSDLSSEEIIFDILLVAYNFESLQSYEKAKELVSTQPLSNYELEFNYNGEYDFEDFKVAVEELLAGNIKDFTLDW
jgi:hypothetical protein